MDRAGSGGLITGKDVAMGQVGRHAGVGGFLGPVPPSKPILSRAEEDCPRALYFGVGGGVFNETRVARTRWDKRENILKKRRNIAPGLPKRGWAASLFSSSTWRKWGGLWRKAEWAHLLLRVVSPKWCTCTLLALKCS